MPTYFLDTSVLVAYFALEDSRSRSIIADLLAGRATAAISLITIAELWAYPDMRDARIEQERLSVISVLEIVGLDQTLARQGGELRRVFNLQLSDALIAASARVTGGRFLTKDAHFARLLRDRVLTGEIYA